MALPDIYSWLNEDEDHKSKIAYQTIMQHVNSEIEGQSLSLRLLIHLYGDIHQPLHCSDRYTENYKEGDKGGNMFPVKNHLSANELHAVWDNAIYAYHASIKKPFTSDSYSSFLEIANDLMKSFSFTKDEIETIDFKKFRDESYEIATSAYEGIKEGDVLPDSYVSKFSEIAKKRAALAGYRLAYIIELIFGSKR